MSGHICLALCLPRGTLRLAEVPHNQAIWGRSEGVEDTGGGWVSCGCGGGGDVVGGGGVVVASGVRG